MKKKGEGIGIMIFSVSFIFVIGFCCLVKLEINQAILRQNIIQDAIQMSALASLKDIDLKYLADEGSFQLDLEKSFKTFKTALMKNLNLDENLNSKDKNIINNNLKIEDYKIYNCSKNNVSIFEFDELGQCIGRYEFNGRNKIKTPKGNIVNETTIYVKVNFDIKRIFNVKNKRLTIEEDVEISK